MNIYTAWLDRYAIIGQSFTSCSRRCKSRRFSFTSRTDQNIQPAQLSFFLVAKSVLNEGHTVSVFLAGDAVQLLRDAVLDQLTGLGTGRLRELYDAIVVGGGRFYLSGMSGKARGVTDSDIHGKPAEFAMPTKLVQLSLDHDRMFTY